MTVETIFREDPFFIQKSQIFAKRELEFGYFCDMTARTGILEAKQRHENTIRFSRTRDIKVCEMRDAEFSSLCDAVMLPGNEIKTVHFEVITRSRWLELAACMKHQNCKLSEMRVDDCEEVNCFAALCIHLCDSSLACLRITPRDEYLPIFMDIVKYMNVVTIHVKVNALAAQREVLRAFASSHFIQTCRVYLPSVQHYERGWACRRPIRASPKRDALLTMISAVEVDRIGLNSCVRVLPVDLIRELGVFLFK